MGLRVVSYNSYHLLKINIKRSQLKKHKLKGKTMNLTNKQKKKLVMDDYDAIAEIYSKDERNIEFYSPFVDKFLASLDGKRGGVLDACCGSGEFSSYIASKNKNVIGVDFSKKLIEIAKIKHKDVEFVEEDICSFKSKSGFDGIFSKDSLFHLPDEDLQVAIQNLYSLLNEKGKMLLILDIPKEAGEKIYVEPLDERFSLYYNYLTVEKVKELLLSNNFKIDEINIHNDSDYQYAQGIMFVYASK